MHTFGAGSLVGTPTYDALGGAIAIPSPIQFGILQDVTVDEEFENKMLHGAYAFPVDVGRGKGKVTLKAKAAEVSAELYNAFFYGQTLVAGFFDLFIDTTGTLIPATPYTITPTVPASGTWGYDLGVRDGNGIPYTRVASSPTTGQYSVAAGVYTFAAADTTKRVFISFQYTNSSTPASAKKLTVANTLMGVAPFFSVDLREQQPNGKNWTVRYPNAMTTKISKGFKNDDFAVPDIEITCFADSSGNISYQCWYE